MRTGEAVRQARRHLGWFVVAALFGLWGLMVVIAAAWSIVAYHIWAVIPGAAVWGLFCYWIAAGALRRATVS